jgi:hypothetical protein
LHRNPTRKAEAARELPPRQIAKLYGRLLLLPLQRIMLAHDRDTAHRVQSDSLLLRFAWSGTAGKHASKEARVPLAAAGLLLARRPSVDDAHATGAITMRTIAHTARGRWPRGSGRRWRPRCSSVSRPQRNAHGTHTSASWQGTTIRAHAPHARVGAGHSVHGPHVHGDRPVRLDDLVPDLRQDDFAVGTDKVVVALLNMMPYHVNMHECLLDKIIHTLCI